METIILLTSVMICVQCEAEAFPSDRGIIYLITQNNGYISSNYVFIGLKVTPLWRMCLEIQLLVSKWTLIWLTLIAQWPTYGIYQWLKSDLRRFFAFADGSNSFLKISSHSGGIDVYVGDGGSAELHSQEGKNTI